MQTHSGREIDFKQTEDQSSEYSVATEKMSIDDKVNFLEKMGREDLVDLFKDWKPRQSSRKRHSAPLDQRVSITVTDAERVSLDNELKHIKSAGEKITMSQFIRNRAIGSVDIQGWRSIAEAALKEIEDIATNQKNLRQRKDNLIALIESEDDEEQTSLFEREIFEIDKKLSKIIAQNEKRNNRLSGRMSMQESETIKWRAQKLCLSSSDYLRMMIFTLEPNSHADAHLSLDAKRRFYISIMDVADNGWGKPPTIYNCPQCSNYIEEIAKRDDRIRQLEMF